MESLVQTHRDCLNQIEGQIIKLLENFLLNCKVIIITNAKKGWVEFSSSILLPRVHKLILKYIPVVSARAEFESQYQGQISEWKKAAFMSLWSIPGLIDSKAMTNLIVIGDAHYEMEAGQHF